MGSVSARRLFPWAAGTLAALGGVYVYRQFQKDMRAAWERIESEGRVVQTARGAIEYGEAGRGFPLLVVHGAGGGYDQALVAGQFILGDAYRVIAPSRFGYLRSPVAADASPEAQADLLASLLDLLGVERATVAAISAGGQAGLQFALRHPERTSALVLVSAITCVPTPQGAPWRQRRRVRCAVASEFAYWLAGRLVRPWLLALLGVSEKVQAAWSAEEWAQADQLLDFMLPFCPRAAGYRLDRSMVVSPEVPLERIQAPTLVIHARDDSIVDPANGLQAAARIPGAESLFVDQGGHLLLGKYEKVRARILSFLGRVLEERSAE